MPYGDDFDAQANALYERAIRIWPDLTQEELRQAGQAAVAKLPNRHVSTTELMEATAAELNRRRRHTGKEL